MTVISREGLERSVPFNVRSEDDSESDGLTLEGYAAVFNQETEINSWEGSFVETIAQGAFKKTIRERTPVMQFDHGRHPLVGSIPIGTIESLSEDESGLAVVGRMAQNWLMEPVREAIANGTVNGMSFRFDVIKEEWRDNQDKILRDPNEIARLLWNPEDRGPLKRTLKELRVHELGPVVFPAYSGTSVGLRASQLADWVTTDERLMYECRSALALGKFGPEIEGDKELRFQVAKRILFGQKISVDSPKPVVPGYITRSEAEELVRKAVEDYKPEIVAVIEPSTNDTQTVEVPEPVRDDHSQKKDVDPNLAAKMRSFNKRAALRLGYLSDEV